MYFMLDKKVQKVDLWGRAQPSANLIKIENNILVIKVLGHACWMGYDGYQYAETEIQVFRVIEIKIDDENTLEGIAERLITHPVRLPKPKSED